MRLVFYGLVQGVGFRPAVYRAARSLGLKGYIRNNGSNVEVVIDGEHKRFLEELRSELPPLAKITNIEIDYSPLDREYEDFKIVMSEDGERSSVIPTDTAICRDCLGELFDSNNRRFRYPFINCTNCGARFSAIAAVPYDRVNTSMEPFELCGNCSAEYDLPTDRRFYAQTISCKDDGPHFELFESSGKRVQGLDEIEHFAELIDEGKIGVLKSWGGMHLICNLENLKRFRKWYSRPEKPFAVMARNIDIARKLARVSPFEEKLLASPQRPIVLVQKRSDRRNDPLLDLVSPGLDNIGLYLPYSAIQHLLFRHLSSDAVLMTSANPPGEPIIIDNEKVFGLKADIYLLHNRRIINRIDDSVVVPYEGRKFFIRKSRGYVPAGLNPRHKMRIVGVGAEENVTSAVSKGGKVYASQYIGDVMDYNVYEYLRNATYHLLDLFGIDEVEAVGADLHPLYTSKHFASELGDRFDCEVLEIQHHWAHAVSLMVDNDVTEPIVCLTLDGAGYGTDGNLWGGEVLLTDFHDFERAARLEYLPLIGGDRAVKDPRRLVFAVEEMLGKDSGYFEDEEASVLKKALKNSPLSCSFGRFLDAISCHLGVCCSRTYDGEPAIKLERYLNQGDKGYELEAKFVDSDVKVVDTLGLFEQLFELTSDGIRSEKQKCDLAYSMVFETLRSMVEIAAERADEEDISRIGITGGVSYNIPIVNMVREEAERRGLTLLSHNNVPNGDGGISIGQNAIAGQVLDKEKKIIL